MKHTPETFAALLHGREYGEEISDAESKVARADGLVVVFAYSDDNCELRGAINDEVGCHHGTTVYFTSDGKVFELPDRDEREVLEKFGLLTSFSSGAKSFDVNWNSQGGPAWSYDASFPHATFDIMEGGEVFCRGIVFRLADAFAPPAVKVAPKSGVMLIAEERQRQKDVEGWTVEHDALYVNGELRDAGIAYAMACDDRAGEDAASLWPWEIDWWKPSDDPIRNLVKAGALIAAEIDRLTMGGDVVTRETSASQDG